MNQLNQFVKAINSWLTFEQMCDRDCLFCESYITYPIGQFLSTRYGASLQSEYPHPVLTTKKRKNGDKPRIDFVILDKNGKISIAIETKWINKSKKLHRDIIRDLIRIELVVHGCNAEGWLIIAGKGKNFDHLISDKKFKGHPAHVGSTPILPFGNSETGSLRLFPPAKYRLKLLKECLQPFQGISVINSIRVTKFGPFPKTYKPNEYVSLLFRIENKQQKERFLPEELFGKNKNNV